MPSIPSILSYGFCTPIHPDLLNVGCCPQFTLFGKLTYRQSHPTTFAESGLGCYTPAENWWETNLYRYRHDFTSNKDIGFTYVNLIDIDEEVHDYFLGTETVIQDVYVFDPRTPSGDCINVNEYYVGPTCSETNYHFEHHASCETGSYEKINDTTYSDLQTPESSLALSIARWGWTTSEQVFASFPLNGSSAMSSPYIENKRNGSGYSYSDAVVNFTLRLNSALKVTQAFKIIVRFELESTVHHTQSPYQVAHNIQMELQVDAGMYAAGKEFELKDMPLESYYGQSSVIKKLTTEVVLI